VDYKDTLNLPKTEFAMAANLAKREPELLSQWTEGRLYERILEAHASDPVYVLHDGPPYANGHIHYGHILNKILKDVVVKSRTMMGHKVSYIPGWDCHGLPIELAVDRELGPKKASMSTADVRRECEAYARRFVDIQRAEFARLGVLGSWDRPYLTLDHSYEATIVRILAAFARGGYLYRGKKPVYWCAHCRTALAEAEVEYQDHSSPSIYVRFPLEGDLGDVDPALAGQRAALVIWTTTPWTLPANLAVVVHPSFTYVAVPVALPGGEEYLILAKDLAESFLAAVKLTSDRSRWVELPPAKTMKLGGRRYANPLGRPAQAPDFRVGFAEYVTLEQGTGLVHTAPGHGMEDYLYGQEHGLDVYAPVDNAGRYTAEVPRWQGQNVHQANPLIMAALVESGHLLSDPKATIAHSYPHCWRCKNPIVFRATPQWFLGLDHAELRWRALEEIDRTRWIPPWGRNRIYGMIEHRVDWCLSRQRAWGVPIPAFYCDACGETLLSADVMEHIAGLFAKDGAGVWFEREAKDLVPPGTKCAKCGSQRLRKEQDIVDVWFESGVSWAAVCENQPDLGVPVDLYLEGSDQHRGWFHSALLTAVGSRGHAPYKAVLTHGFVLDEQGRPYSKTEIEKARREGRTIEYIDPKQVIEKQGAELFRLWVASEDYRNDVAYSRGILDQLAESYRKIRNTVRFALGNLSDFDPARDAVPVAELLPLDRYFMGKLARLAARLRTAYEEFEFHLVFRALIDFCAVDLSAYYFDVLKDRLYCDPAGARSRRSGQTVLYAVARTLATLMAPIFAFTAEDVWRHLPRLAGDPDSVHLAAFHEPPAVDTATLDEEYAVLERARETTQKALEEFRARKNKSTDAAVTLTLPEAEALIAQRHLPELADYLVVARVEVKPGESRAATVARAPGERCPRCWKRIVADAATLCPRCQAALGAKGTAA
jgi:isoleucyl-tRNA synthetase